MTEETPSQKNVSQPLKSEPIEEKTYLPYEGEEIFEFQPDLHAEFSSDISYANGLQDPDVNSYENLRKEHKKSEWSILHKIKVGAMVLVATVGMIVIAVYFFHLVAPENWCWLTGDRLELLKNTAISITTGLGVGIALTLLHDS